MDDLTKEEKTRMYNSLTKKQLVGMLVNLDFLISKLYEQSCSKYNVLVDVGNTGTPTYQHMDNTLCGDGC